MDPNLNTPTVAPPQPQPQPQPKKSKLGLILGLSIGGGILIIGIIVTVLLLVLGGGVSKQDYQEAQDAASDLRTPYSKLTSTYVSSYSTDTQIKNAASTLKDNRAPLNDSLKKLSEAKAIKNDKEAAELYKKVADEKTKLDTYLDIITEAYEVIYPAAKEMTNMSVTDASGAISALKKYQTELESLKLNQKVNKDYMDTINSILPEFISAVEAYANMSYSNYDSSLYKKVSDMSSKLTDADTDWRSNIEKLQDDLKFSDALNDLGEYLTDKASGQ
jgi:hypothetical protein